MFFRFLLRALLYRKQRLILAFAALSVAATLATVLFGIYGTVERRIREEFRGYGANIAAVALDGTTIPLALALAAEQNGAEAAPFLITAGRLNNTSVAVAGFIPAKAAPLTPYWHVEGTRDLKPGECLAGETLAATLNLKIGQSLPLANAPCRLTGIVSTGAAEDQELLVRYEDAAKISGLSDVASAIQIRISSDKVDALRTRLATQFPTADIRTVRAVAGTESNVAVKLRSSIFLLTLLILAITTLCVSSNFSELVLERSREIGLLKALGGAERKIAAFFLSESATLAILASIIGYGLGLLASAAIGKEVFGGLFRIEPDWLIFAAVTAVMFLVASIATAISTSRIWTIQPAVILRGE